MSEYINTEVVGKILKVELTYEKTLNCMNYDMLRELADIVRNFTHDPELQVMVLTGKGRAFCTGADLKTFADLSPEGIVDYCTTYEEDIFHQLACCRKVTIAAVNGYAMGGGFELALACDFRVGWEKTLFSCPEYGFGWLPGWGGVHRLAAVVGPVKAKEIGFLQKKVRGKEAYELGLLNEYVETPEEVVPAAMAMAEKVAELNPLTVAYTKTVLDDFNVSPMDDLLQSSINGITSKMPYCRERIDAFFNRKK